MHRFPIVIKSFLQIREFVSVATVQPFDVIVENEKQQINGKSFIGMFSLDLKRPLFVRVKCSQEELVRFQKAAAQFLA